MPYIEQTDQERAEFCPRTPGELNFAITTLISGYVSRKGVTYTHFNDCLGALEGAKAEFYRRVIVPYEEAKRQTNGDVYPVGILP